MALAVPYDEKRCVICMIEIMRFAIVALATILGLVSLPLPVTAAPASPAPAAWTHEADRHADDGFRRLDAGDAIEAETAFRTAIALLPGHPRALAGLGLALLRRGRHLAAAAQFQKAVSCRLSADLAAQCYAGLATICDGQGLTDLAIRYGQRAVRLHPKALYQALLARLYLAAHRLDEARAAAEAARQSDPDHQTVLPDLQVGNTHTRTGTAAP